MWMQLAWESYFENQWPKPSLLPRKSKVLDIEKTLFKQQWYWFILQFLLVERLLHNIST